VGGLSDRAARALLSRVAEPGDRQMSALLRHHEAAEVVDRLRAAADPALDRFRSRLPTADPDADLARATAVGGRLLVPSDLEWPSQLADLGDAQPWALWVRGTVDLRMAAVRSVAVVGARAATSYGSHVASGLGADLAAAGWTVVSGGAFGIDAAAHAGALAGHGSTVAVLACGVDVAYPPRHDALFARIASDGLLVSEVPPGAAPHRGRFLVRNRLIAALTRGTVVVEAALRSGALSTARDAEQLGRPVLAVPGPVTSPMSQGVHRELRRGATLVTSAAEVIEAVGDLGTDLAAEPSGPVTVRDTLDPLSARVLDGVPARRPATVESVARTAGVTTAEAAAALGLLELAGLVRLVRDGWVLVR
jgi:DNA processing protein